MALVPESPLRGADPRTKLVLSLVASLAVMLPLDRLLIALLLYVLLLAWARLLGPAVRQVWRIKWLLIGLFCVDWLLISHLHAVLVTLRLVLLAGSFTLFFATTTPAELRLALEWARVPHRYAFSISLAFQSLGLLDQEWRAILEAQQARGAWNPPRGWRRPLANVRDLIALSVPAIVMTTKRAWALTEAAYARGFDSPHRRPYHQLAMSLLDWALLAGSLIACGVFLVWR
jgi:energy-coupling factor transporter transmembrane protein EcfT